MHAQSDLREQSPCKKPIHLNVSAITYCHWLLLIEELVDVIKHTGSFRLCCVGTLRMALMLFPELLDSQLHQNEGFNDAALKWLKTFGLQGCLDI